MKIKLETIELEDADRLAIGAMFNHRGYATRAEILDYFGQAIEASRVLVRSEWESTLPSHAEIRAMLGLDEDEEYGPQEGEG